MRSPSITERITRDNHAMVLKDGTERIEAIYREHFAFVYRSIISSAGACRVSSTAKSSAVPLLRLRSNYLNLADEIADEFYLVGFREFHVAELIFDHDNQFKNIDLIVAEIVREVRVSRYRIDVSCRMLGDERSDLAGDEAFFLSRCSSRRCPASHDHPPY